MSELLTLYQAATGQAPKRLASGDGGEWAGPCPACGGKDRFRIWPSATKGPRWWCRGCEKKGDLPGFLITFQGLTFRQAQERLGLKRPGDNGAGKVCDHKASRQGAGRKAEEEWTPIMPVPYDAGPAPESLWLATPHKRPPDARWAYKDAEGRLLGGVARWDTPGQDRGKDIRPVTFCQRQAGRKEWRFKLWPAPRPLYGLDRLAARPEAPALMVEGEKAADAAQAMFPDMVAVTSPSGSKAARMADWRPLAGRPVFIWPDHDEPGRTYAQAVAGLVMEAGAAAVKVVEVPGDFPPGWDLADDPPEGWDKERLLSLLEAAPVWAAPPAPPEAPSPAQPSDWPYRSDDKGLWYNAAKPGEDPDWRWVCSPLVVAEATRNAQGDEWGLVLRVQDKDGELHEWAMPRAMLAGDGREYRARLLSMGLHLAPGPDGRRRLEQYLSKVNPRTRARCVAKIGWTQDGAFILPNAVFGRTGAERIVFQGGSEQGHAFHVGGSLEEWQEQVAKLCVGNSRLALSVSAAFAAPCLGLVGAEGGGLHFVGGSSLGKTTALGLAGSVWGGGESGYVKSWRSTANGLESLGLLHNHALLALDEISLIDSREAGEAAELLANGQGKSRAKQDGGGLPVAQFRLLFLSTGEQSLAAKMLEAGKKSRGGQEVRLLEVPADAGANMGIFETLHGFASPATLADHLKQAAAANYGHPIRAFLEKITADPDRLPAIREAIRIGREKFLERYCPPEAGGQVKRGALRVGLMAAAGELAITLGILPWPEGEAMRAAGVCFLAWIETRGGTGALELSRGVSQVRRFFQEHGRSRFELAVDNPSGPPIRDRAGFRKPVETLGEEGWEYLAFPGTFTHEICSGFDSKALARELVRLGLLLPDAKGKTSQSVKLPGMDKKSRFYVFPPAVLVEE